MSEEGIGYSEKIHIDDLLERMAAENIPMKYVQHYARQNGADCGFIGVETLVPGTTVTQLRQLTAQACTESTTMKDHFFTNQRIALRSSKAIRSDVTRVKKLISKAYMAGKWLENAGLALLVKKLNGTLKKSVRVISCTDKQNYTLYDGSIDTVPGHSIQTADQLVDLLKSDDVYGILVNKGNYHWVATVKVARATLADGRRRSLRLHAAPSGAPMPSPLTSPPPQPEAPGSSRQRGPSTTPPPSPPCGPPGDDKYLPCSLPPPQQDQQPQPQPQACLKRKWPAAGPVPSTALPLLAPQTAPQTACTDCSLTAAVSVLASFRLGGVGGAIHARIPERGHECRHQYLRQLLSLLRVP